MWKRRHCTRRDEFHLANHLLTLKTQAQARKSNENAFFRNRRPSPSTYHRLVDN